jgi:hypothetical protein
LSKKRAPKEFCFHPDNPDNPDASFVLPGLQKSWFEESWRSVERAGESWRELERVGKSCLIEYDDLLQIHDCD